MRKFLVLCIVLLSVSISFAYTYGPLSCHANIDVNKTVDPEQGLFSIEFLFYSTEKDNLTYAISMDGAYIARGLGETEKEVWKEHLFYEFKEKLFFDSRNLETGEHNLSVIFDSRECDVIENKTFSVKPKIDLEFVDPPDKIFLYEYETKAVIKVKNTGNTFVRIIPETNIEDKVTMFWPMGINVKEVADIEITIKQPIEDNELLLKILSQRGSEDFEQVLEKRITLLHPGLNILLKNYTIDSTNATTYVTITLENKVSTPLDTTFEFKEYNIYGGETISYTRTLSAQSTEQFNFTFPVGKETHWKERISEFIINYKNGGRIYSLEPVTLRTEGMPKDTFNLYDPKLVISLLVTFLIVGILYFVRKKHGRLH